VRIDHLSRLPVMPPSTFDVNLSRARCVEENGGRPMVPAAKKDSLGSVDFSDVRYLSFINLQDE